ncbi:MAG: NAD(P)-dependent oxidoreductase [Bacteroidales bacterium]|nr:NAD(P)-dependent oxidoreductase [Bacteroidales bacterium]
MKENLFIIGGSGFIGKNLTEYFLNDFNIYIIDRNIDEDFFLRQDNKIISDKNLLKQRFNKLITQINFAGQPFILERCSVDLINQEIPANLPDPDYIINLASIVTAQRDLSLFDSMISSNLKVLMNLYNRYKDCKTLKLFIQFGSSEEYGNTSSPYWETMREEPDSPYALVKQLTVNTALMLYRNYSFPVAVVRPGNLFGKYQNPQKFIPYIIQQLKANKELNVTPCRQKRDFIYAEDFAWCISQLLQNYDKIKGQIINVASGQSTELKEIIEYLKSVIGSRSLINYGALPYRENEAMDLCCSVKKFEELTLKKIDFDIFKRLQELAKQ